ncbi:hypothetical protein NEAUS07_2125, partial [Nematocida ausubeli]
MRMKTHECLYKRKNSQISIKLLAKVLLIGTLMGVQNVFGLLPIEEMEDVLKELLDKYKKNNTESYAIWLLSPIMLYLHKEIDTLHNVRFNPRYINEQTAVPDKENILQNIDRTNDTVREEDSEGNELPKSTVDHYSALINMFPSPDGKVRIHPKKGCKDSFTSFLRSEHVKEYAHSILAILLLRAEGVPVPLRIENEESTCPKLTWTNECNPEESFSVPICTTSMEGQESNSSSEEANIKKINRKLLQTIKYFLNAEFSQELKESIAQQESVEKENYWENEFTETPAWLIQLYIYYYLETKKNAIDFYDEVAEKLRFCMDVFIQDSSYKDIIMVFFKKLIIRQNTKPSILKWWKEVKWIKNVVEAVKEPQLHPFKDNSQLPAKKTVQEKSEENNKGNNEENNEENIQSKEGLISSDIESVLLTLLCCFVYNPKTDKYNVEQIPHAQEEVKNLFGMPSKNTSTTSDSSEPCGNPDIGTTPSNNIPVIQLREEMPQEVWSKWSEIIQNIVEGDENISYITVENNKRVIQPNILNILIIMIKLTGMDYDENITRIQKYRDRLQDPKLMRNDDLVKSLESEIANYAEEIFSQMG